MFLLLLMMMARGHKVSHGKQHCHRRSASHVLFFSDEFTGPPARAPGHEGCPRRARLKAREGDLHALPHDRDPQDGTGAPDEALDAVTRKSASTPALLATVSLVLGALAARKSPSPRLRAENLSSLLKEGGPNAKLGHCATTSMHENENNKMVAPSTCLPHGTTGYR